MNSNKINNENLEIDVETVNENNKPLNQNSIIKNIGKYLYFKNIFIFKII